MTVEKSSDAINASAAACAENSTWLQQNKGSHPGSSNVGMLWGGCRQGGMGEGFWARRQFEGEYNKK